MSTNTYTNTHMRNMTITNNKDNTQTHTKTNNTTNYKQNTNAGNKAMIRLIPMITANE